MSTISMLFLVFSTLLLLGLQWHVIARRRTEKIALGEGEDRQLMRRVRVHANAFENLVPFSVLLIASDLNGVSPGWLVVPILMMVLGRVLHPLGMLNPKKYHVTRVIGMACSILATVILAVLASVSVFA